MRLTKTLLFSSVVSLALLAAPLFLSDEIAQAADGSDFKADRIIDDGVFYDTATMTVSDIQTFLEDMLDGGNFPDGNPGSCDSDGSEAYGGTTKAQYAQSSYDNGGNGNPAPFVCLPDYWENPSTGENNYYEYNESQDRFENVYDGTKPSGSKSAAQLIYDVAQEHGINPQVLIVLLQKEQSLVTDDWSWGIQYYKATGFACPDTGPCNTAYAGFYKQVWNAARQFIRYRDNPQNYGYIAGQNNSILWHPNSSCGSSTVFIQNQATAGLYNYTPYRPNSAALNNLYGTGNSCSSYGNRNFWRLFTDWFGPTIRNYTSSTISRCCHQDVFQGENPTAQVRFKNTGNVDWYDQTGATGSTPEVMLYTTRPLFTSSPLGGAWTAKTLVARNFSAVYESDNSTLAANQHKVEPGQIARYNIVYNVPIDLPTGDYITWMQPAIPGQPNAFNDPAAWLKTTVKRPTYKSSVYKRCCHQNTVPGKTLTGEMWFKNTGNVNWYDKVGATGARPETMLYTARPLFASSPLGGAWTAGKLAGPTFSAVYESDGETLSSSQHVVEPGQIARYNITFKVPTNLTAGDYVTWMQPAIPGYPKKFNDPASWLKITVTDVSYRASTIYRCCHQEALPGDTPTAELRFKNTGNVDWYDKTGAASTRPEVMLYTSRPLFNESILGDLWTANKLISRDFSAVYESDNSTLAGDQHKVTPGQIARYNITFKVPTNLTAGDYVTWMQPAIPGQPGAFNDPGAWLKVTVK